MAKNTDINFGKLANIKRNIAKKHPDWSEKRVIIAAHAIMGKDGKATDVPVSELKLFKSTEGKLVEAGFDTVGKIRKATDEELIGAGLSEKAVAAVRTRVNGEKKAVEAPKKAEAKGTPIAELKLFKGTEKRVLDAGITTVEALKAAKDETLAKAGLSEKAIAAVRKMVA